MFCAPAFVYRRKGKYILFAPSGFKTYHTPILGLVLLPWDAAPLPLPSTSLPPPVETWMDGWFWCLLFATCIHTCYAFGTWLPRYVRHTLLLLPHSAYHHTFLPTPGLLRRVGSHPYFLLPLRSCAPYLPATCLPHLPHRTPPLPLRGTRPLFTAAAPPYALRVRCSISATPAAVHTPRIHLPVTPTFAWVARCLLPAPAVAVCCRAAPAPRSDRLPAAFVSGYTGRHCAFHRFTTAYAMPFAVPPWRVPAFQVSSLLSYLPRRPYLPSLHYFSV